MIRELAAAGKCVLVSSHILTELGEMCDTVGIIERGQLLAVGKVADIQSKLRPHTDIMVELLSGGDRLGKWLLGQPAIAEIQATDRVVRFQFTGDPHGQVQLLRALMTEGYEVIQFQTEARSLEDVFLQVTTGSRAMSRVSLAGGRIDEVADVESVHRISQDPVRTWEKWWQRGGELVNPILVKEVRQALKSRQFEVSFGLTLLAAVCWTLLFMSINVPRMFYTPGAGAELLRGYAFILLVPLLIIIPFSAFSIADQRSRREHV